MSLDPASTPRDGELFEAGGIRVLAEIPGVDSQSSHEPQRRGWRIDRILLPLALFVATCFSTYRAGARDGIQFFGPMLGLDYNLGRVADGLIYMVAVMGILFAHEMGHFLQAIRYHVPASLPFFIPMPISEIGTMGAVISMQGSRANRRQLFDIGLSGPWAGLFLAIPITIVGILIARVSPAFGAPYYADPLIFRLLMWLLRSDMPADRVLSYNPLLMAGWVGMLITGLNMLPVSQLDGGHVIYALFGSASRWVARGFLILAGCYIVFSGNFVWTPMYVLVTLIGCDHPPTADDNVKLGPLRWWIGAISSVAIPILCFMPTPFPALMR